MESKTLSYQNDDIKVTYDIKRCIHAAECVKGLPGVFDPKRKPWIDPDNADASEIADVIERCPTGALHYELKSGNKQEQPASPNRIQLTKDGPVYFFGDVIVQDHEGNTVLEDTRFALCRCGASANKPACDNSHKEVKWKADTDANTAKMPAPSKSEGGKLIIKLMKDGPAILDGHYVMESDSLKPHASDKGVALCRCGASSTKPFCDGTHKSIDFKS